MSEKTLPPAIDAIHWALEGAGGAAYVKAPSPAALATVMDAVARLEEPPLVRVLARREPIDGWLRRSTPGAREPIDGGAVELRASRTVVTDTTVVTEAGIVRVSGEEPSGAAASGDRSFVESVYEAHDRAWKRAEPVIAGERRAASG